jgi:hypothetical protein
MSFEIKTRYGAKEAYETSEDAPTVIEGLLEELETEEFDEPDNEHTEVAVSFGEWAVTAQVSGLLTQDDLRGIVESESHRPAEALYLRAVSRSQVKEILIAMAEGRLEDVRRAGWAPFDRVPPFRKDLFRKKSPP